VYRRILASPSHTAGPKTVRINLAAAEEAENIVSFTFETQPELREFIGGQSAAGLRNGDDKSISKLMQVCRSRWGGH
jgi:hypothetical protein